jgi:chromosome segregation ATPase
MMAMNVTQSMELTQAMQTLKWLDEERRKDKASIATLQEREQNLELQLAQQAAQLQELQRELTGIQGVISRVSGFEEIVTMHKSELLLEMDNREQTRRKELAESERLRRIEYETLTTNLNQLERELRVLPQYDEGLNTLRAENQRLNEVFQHLDVDLADLRKRVEDPLQAITYLEEQRRADTLRIAAVEDDLPDVRKRVETLAQKFPGLEEAIQKQRVRIDDAVQETKKYEQPIEELRVSDFQREQKLKKYLDQGAQVAQEMERLRQQTQGFVEQQQLVNRALSALDKFKMRIERRQDEIVERQRLTDEQIQQRWEEWQVARAKEQKKREVIIEERWRQQEQTNVDLRKHTADLNVLIKAHRSQLDALWESLRADANSLLKAAQDVYETLIAPIDEQLTTLRSEQQE